MGKTVGLTYDLRSSYVFKEGDPHDANAEFDSEELVDNIAGCLKMRGHRVVKIGNARDLLRLSPRISELCLDIVFNISEGLQGRNRESQVPIILEMMDIPFVGADGLALGLTLDKCMAKKILLCEEIPTPNFIELKDDLDSAQKLNGLLRQDPPSSRLRRVSSEALAKEDFVGLSPEALAKGDGLKFPLIVKPRYEGSSKGIKESSKVDNIQELKRQVHWVIDTYRQPALVEEFIEGSEFTVAIIGNDPPVALPVVQIEIDGKLQLDDLFYTYEHIHSGRLEYICPAHISEQTQRDISELAVRTYQAVECRDFGRVDFRLDRRGNPFVLEINPLPSLSMEDVFMVVARQLGISYEKMVNRILEIALKRYNL